jgi:hypothetical protein
MDCRMQTERSPPKMSDSFKKVGSSQYKSQRVPRGARE